MIWPSTAPAAEGHELKDMGFDARLYSMLRDIRQTLADRDNVPVYVVFSNKTLEALCRYRPSNVEDGLAVPGIGEAKAQRYLPAFLRVLAEGR